MMEKKDSKTNLHHSVAKPALKELEENLTTTEKGGTKYCSKWTRALHTRTMRTRSLKTWGTL